MRAILIFVHNLSNRGPGSNASAAFCLCLFFVCPLLASCTSVEIEDHSLQFNQAAGSLSNRVLLLNVVRAAKGYPLQFSKLTSYQGQSRLDGGVSLNIPFIADVIGKKPPSQLLQGSATPSATFKTGVQSLALSDLNTAEIQRGLRETATANDYVYYRSQGWPKALVNTMLIEHLLIHPRLEEAIFAAANESCRGNRLNDVARRVCRRILPGPPRACVGKGATEDGELASLYTNDPQRPCEFEAFQRLFASIRVVDGVTLDIRKPDFRECKDWVPPDEKTALPQKERSSTDEKDGRSGQPVSIKDGKASIDVRVTLEKKDEEGTPREKSLDLFFRIPRASAGQISTAVSSLRDKYLCLFKEGRNPISVVWRSPERMVRFLGDVLAVQTYRGAPSFRILNDAGHDVPLFLVEAGRGILTSAAVSVEGPDRENYVILAPEPASESGHLSLPALAIVTMSLNQAVSGKALPAPTTFFVPGG